MNSVNYVFDAAFSSTFSDVRWNMYYVAPGYIPVCWFDGVNNYIGGSYPAYKTIIENRLAVPSPMTITINENKGDVSIDIYLEEDVPTGCKVYLIACENHVEYQGKTEQFTAMCENNQYPIINGQSLGISSAGESTTFNASYDFNELCYQNPLMMYLVCWVQDMDSQSSTYKEVMQSAQLFDPPYDSDLDIQPTSLGHIKSLFQ